MMTMNAVAAAAGEQLNLYEELATYDNFVHVRR
jgi:hypothetical protein